MTVESLVNQKCEQFLSKLNELVARGQTNRAVRPGQIDAIQDLARRFDRSIGQTIDSIDSLREEGPAPFYLVASTFDDARRAAVVLGSPSLSLQLWRAEKSWVARGHFRTRTLRRLLVGTLYSIWRFSSGYSTRPIRIVLGLALIWCLATTVLLLNSNDLPRCETWTTARVAREAYTAFSALTSVGNVDTSNAAGPLYYTVLATTSVLGTLSLFSLLSIVGVYIVIGERA